MQGLVKGAKLCFRYPYFYFWHGESTSTASQKSKDLNKVPLLLQDLACKNISEIPFPSLILSRRDLVITSLGHKSPTAQMSRKLKTEKSADFQ